MPKFLYDDFDHRAGRLNTPKVPKVEVVQPKGGPWTGNQALGAETLFVMNDANRQAVLKLPEWGFPETWRVTLGVDQPSTYATGFPIAHITIGTGGTSQRFELDWKQGTVFSAGMNAIEVYASYDRIGALVAADPLTLRVMLARGAGVAPSPTRTYYPTWVAAGGGWPANTQYAAVAIPPLAHRLRLLQGYDTSAWDSIISFYTMNPWLFFASTPVPASAVEIDAQEVELIGNTAGYSIPPVARYVISYMTLPAGHPGIHPAFQFEIGI